MPIPQNRTLFSATNSPILCKSIDKFPIMAVSLHFGTIITIWGKQIVMAFLIITRTLITIYILCSLAQHLNEQKVNCMIICDCLYIQALILISCKMFWEIDPILLNLKVGFNVKTTKYSHFENLFVLCDLYRLRHAKNAVVLNTTNNYLTCVILIYPF